MKLFVFFPKDSEAVFNRNSNRTFGGATIHLYQFAKELHHYDNIEILSLIPNYSKIDFDDEKFFNLHKLYNEKDNAIVKFYKFHKFSKSEKPDFIIQLGLTAFSCILALYCFLRKINFVFMFAHDVESLGFYQNKRKKSVLFPIIIKFAKVLITQNNIEKENLLKKYAELKNIRVLQKGIDFTKLSKNTKKKFDIIWIARCEPWKNVEAYLELAKLNPLKSFLLICPSCKGKEDYFNSIREKAGHLRNIDFRDFIPYEKVYETISLARIMCVTSDSEGDWPLTVLEGTAMGLPVLSYSFNYGKLIDEYNGGFFCGNSIDELNKYFNMLISENKLLENYSSNAKRFALENHDIKTNTKLLINYLSEFL
ncbi:glycosyltransferase family 4 protein [Spirochaetota bacterium]